METFIFKLYPSIFFWAMAVLLLVIGLRGLLIKRPFLFSARWMFLAIAVLLLGPMVMLILSPFLFVRPPQLLGWITAVMVPVMALIIWYQTQGYLAFAVTGKSFRDGLLGALHKLNLPYEESLSSIRLTSVEAELQVAVQSWLGTGQIKVRQGRQRHLLKEIVQAMNAHFRTSPVETNRISCVFSLIVGIFSVLMGIAPLFRVGLP